MPRRPAAIPPPPEREVQATCCDILAAHGCRVERRNTGVMRVEDPTRKGGYRYVRFGEDGAADLFGEFPSGRAYNLEVKREGERPRLEQVRWLRSANRWAPAFWVESAEELERFLPPLIEGASIIYRPGKWRFRVEIEVPGGGKVKDWLMEAGGDFDIGWAQRRRG